MTKLHHAPAPRDVATPTPARSKFSLEHKAAQVPHQNLYTRLQSSPIGGIGVFAIRDIPQGTYLFAGDAGRTVRVPLSDFETITDPEVRRMYMDFCPMIDGAFLAPADFNQLTMSWYVNHSKEPNIRADRQVQFTALRLIPKGEELTADYTQYSDHAQTHSRSWKQR